MGVVGERERERKKEGVHLIMSRVVHMHMQSGLLIKTKIQGMQFVTACCSKMFAAGK